MTRVVTEALRERLERIQKRDPETLAADLWAIAKRAAVHVSARISTRTTCSTTTYTVLIEKGPTSCQSRRRFTV